MDRKELLGKFIDSIVNGDTEAAKAAFDPYISSKSREILGTEPETEAAPVNEQLTKLQEMFDVLADSPVKLRGDRVYVDGRQVGSIQSDPTDLETGINFIEDGGKFSKEFDEIEELFDFLINKYTKRGNV